ncbi:hypothetical protein FZI36_14160 [Cronobacter sakazakii]|nr:hypothetical protein FZI27_12020 [Cronobacter sakazakii]KAB1480718.1 hypothetical protein AUM88_01025 [Cronobacter sakazakii]KAB2165357.1 hypothetical protein FZI34_10230 [Cronobacter sakazakii]KAB2167388.1 hypothetical protein FZI36_14160 [Cronobacter sakazakii]MCI0187850.1 hypothetical protein [Cronobacter sakazakii]
MRVSISLLPEGGKRARQWHFYANMMITYFNHLFYPIIIKMIKNAQIKIMLKTPIFSARCLAPHGVR